MDDGVGSVKYVSRGSAREIDRRYPWHACEIQVS